VADRAIARRYASAFLELAKEADQVAVLGEDLDETLQAVRAEGGELMRVLSNPVFTADERRAVLNAVIPALELQPVAANLLRLLVDKGRFGLLPELVDIYHQEADRLAGRLRVGITTAEPLSDDLAGEIRAALARATGSEVVLDLSVDPDLIGGLVARVGGKVYDASMRARLEDLKQRLIQGTTPAQA
jgi:F-type H+-transporting ATPase subunit delta